LNLALLVCAAVILLPLIWMTCAALKTGSDLFSYTFLPWDHLNRLTFANFQQLFTGESFGRWFINSLFLASAQTVLMVLLSSLGGFALAKYQFPGRRAVMLLMLGTLLLPAQVLLPSEYELMYHLGWIDSFASILIPGAVSVFGLLLFRQAIRHVPDELLQSARLDGCSELRLWWQIVLPIVRPTSAAFTLVSFLTTWNSFLWPQIMLQDPAKYTLPIALANLMGLPQFGADYGVLMAATLLGIVPVAILFFALQQDFIEGLASGAVKA
jgi:ABC-type glycerol-3-phosphate transport system permease component